VANNLKQKLTGLNVDKLDVVEHQMLFQLTQWVILLGKLGLKLDGFKLLK